MDIGYTYATGQGTRVSLYAPPGVLVPDALRLEVAQQQVIFHRLSDRDLHCGTVPGFPGSCDNTECHRRTLGECQCGRHEPPVPFRPVGR